MNDSIVIPFPESDVTGECLECGQFVSGEASVVLTGGRATVVSIAIVTKDSTSHPVARTVAGTLHRVPVYVQPGGTT
jgi:hypothetical protein